MRNVHAETPDVELVRYSPAGRWFFESKDGRIRSLCTLAEAVDYAVTWVESYQGSVHMGLPGGVFFDQQVYARTCGGSCIPGCTRPECRCADVLATVPEQYRSRLSWVDGCLRLPVSISTSGYVQIRVDSRYVTAHRWLYEQINGPVPAELHMDHLCRNRWCINAWDHLEPVTCQVNVLRGVGPAAEHAAKTHCPQGHPYSPENTIYLKRGWRRCRSCKRAESRRSSR